MLTSLFKTMIVVIWMGSMAWLVRYEALPHLFDETVQGYRGLSNELPAMRDTWMKVVSNGNHVGYLNSSIEMMDIEGREELSMSTKLNLRILFQGQNELLRFQNEVRLSPRSEILSSTSRLFLAGIHGELTLTPQEEEQYQLDITFNDVLFSRSITIPDEAIIASPLMDQVLRSVKAGQTLKIRALDPFSIQGELRTIEVRGIRTERKFLPRFDEFLEVTRVETHFGDIVLESDVDEYGRVLWQKTPFGLTFLESSSNHAVDVPEGNMVDPAELFSSQLFNQLLPEAPLP